MRVPCTKYHQFGLSGMKTGLFLILLLVSNVSMLRAQNVVWATVLNDIRSRYDDVTHITVDSLGVLMESSETPFLIDVREPEEYAVSHLEGAINLIPDATNFAVLEGIPKDTPIVAYCSIGYRSSEMARKLQKAGFTNVVNLEGSIFAWANGGNPLFQDQQQVYSVHPYNAVWGQLLNPKMRKYD